jgi:1-acyl-sn-glycerol-3-phosphate acyltransferase
LGTSVIERAASYGRALVAAPVFVGLTLASSAGALALSTFGWRRGIDAIIRAWARTALKMHGVRLDVGGLENLPDEPAVYVFNHQSHVDILSIHAALERSLRFGAKIELFRIPLFGRAMRAAGVLPIPRGDRASAVHVYHDAEARFAEGYSFALAPEGTRQDEPRIGAFKKGPFHFALDARVPIVPLVLDGTADVLPKHALAINGGRWHRTVKLRVLPPVRTAGREGVTTDGLRDEVRAAMTAAYEALRPRPGRTE